MVSESHGTFVYAPAECRSGNRIQLLEAEDHHLRRVLRKTSDSPVFVTDGAGMVYKCYATDTGELEIIQELPEYGECETRVTLLVGMLKGDGNRDVVDDATQLGVQRIIFYQGTRSEGEISEHKFERLQRAAISAIKQCGRARLPELLRSASLGEALSIPESVEQIYVAQQYVALEREGPAEFARNVSVIVGPEGGLDDTELAILPARGIRAIQLGPRRLRSGMAVNAAMSFILAKRGEFR